MDTYLPDPDTKRPLDHVARPDLPWRVSTTTECGRPIADVKAIIGRDELLSRLRVHGKARTSLLTCMTCWQTASRWSTFDVDPVDALRREVLGGRTEPTLAVELRALAALAEEHRDEFEQFITGMGETVDFAARRRQAGQRRAAGPGGGPRGA